jgi:hypothetical protein
MAGLRDEIDALVVDRYEQHEGTEASGAAFTGSVKVPFQATLSGLPVEVQDLRVSDNTIQCEVLQDGQKRWVSVEELDAESLPEACRHMLALFGTWAGEASA